MSTDERPYGRRVFLGVLGAGVSSLWWGPSAYHGAAGLLSPVAGEAPAALRDAVPSLGGGWRVYAVNPPMPRFDAARWRLRIEGLVERPLTLTYAELRDLPSTTQVADFHCVTGWSVPGVHWRGVRLADVLALAGVRPNARAIRFESAERPYQDSLSFAQARRPDAMLAYDLDGRPLSREHGAPVRLVMPAMYGYKSVKWVERVVATPDVRPGYWERRGYDADAWVGGFDGQA